MKVRVKTDPLKRVELDYPKFYPFTVSLASAFEEFLFSGLPFWLTPILYRLETLVICRILWSLAHFFGYRFRIMRKSKLDTLIFSVLMTVPIPFYVYFWFFGYWYFAILFHCSWNIVLFGIRWKTRGNFFAHFWEAVENDY